MVLTMEEVPGFFNKVKLQTTKERVELSKFKAQLRGNKYKVERWKEKVADTKNQKQKKQMKESLRLKLVLSLNPFIWGSWRPSGQKCKSAMINIGWVRLSPW